MAESAPTYLDEMTLDDLWERRDALKTEARALSNHITYVEMEIVRRAREAHPDVDVEEGGTIQASGDRWVISYGLNRKFEYDAFALEHVRHMLTPSEWDKLVPKLEPVVSGTAFNALLKRGGMLAEALQEARKLTNRSVRLSAKARQ